MFDFFRATPGVAATSPSSGTATSISVFGSGTNENQFLLDGGNTTCPCNGAARAEPGIDFIQEIQVQSIGASAEFGNLQGGVFNVITRQGGERFQYDSSYYAQASGLTAQPVRLPLAQRLTGAVANGDLARANFAGDYKPQLLRTEVVDGEPMHVLELTAIDRSVTYHRVLYWVRKSNNWPYKAEFYSLSDRLLKTCHYQKFERMAGRMRPTRLTMHDALRADEESVLEYADMRLRDLPDKIFTKDYLKRLE